jgi:predicted peroxiredoxin
MKKALLATAAIALTSGLLLSAAGQTDTPAVQKVVVHLSHFTDDLHAGFMAVKLAKAMQARGASVTVFVDLEGARLADARQSLTVFWGPSDVPLASHYGEFIQAGGSVLVCPHCAHAAGMTADSIRDGARIGTEEELAAMLLEADKILDY